MNFPMLQMRHMNTLSEKPSRFKLFSLPVPNIVGIIFIAASILAFAGSAFAIYALLTRPAITTEVKAAQTLVGHDVYVTPDANVVGVSAITTEPALVLLHIDPFFSFVGEMETDDGINHGMLIPDLPDGTYTYYFTIGANDDAIESEKFTLTLPILTEQ